MIPLYGFLEGDTLGILVLAAEDETIADVAVRLQSACSLRVAAQPRVQVIHDGRELPPELTVAAAELKALDRIDVIAESAPMTGPFAARRQPTACGAARWRASSSADGRCC